MSNNLTSNITRNVAEELTQGFETDIVLAKLGNREIFRGYPNPASGQTIYARRYHQYRNVPTSDGDITNETWNSIVAGKAPATTQSWITVPLSFTSMEEATQLDSLKRIVRPAYRRVVSSLELIIAQFLLENLGLSYGTPESAVDAWKDIAGCDALLDEMGATGKRYYVTNAFTKMNLADTAAGLNSASKVDDAWSRASVGRMVGNMMFLTSNALKTRTTGACADRVGAVTSAPDATYVTAKDSMTQTLAVTGLTTAGVIEEGEVIEYATVYQCNPDTGEIIYRNGSPVPFRQTVVTGVTLSGGAGSITVAPAGLYESNGQYNNISKAIPQSEVITILGSTATTIKPDIFFDEDAYTVGTVKLPKLHSTDTLIETESGFSMRVSMYADGDASVQKMRVDLVPVLGILNPMLGGQSFGGN